MNTRERLATTENLKKVGRKTVPTTDNDWDYFVTQLIETAIISLHDGVKLYVR